MNPNKVAFIIVYNNELYKDECAWYINRLICPENIDIEIITINNASSMCAGYNEAMSSSDAKYKVYLHQDVFILNQNFISDMIKCFTNNPSYGLLGVIGCSKLPSNGSAFDHWDLGCIETFDAQKRFPLLLRQNQENNLSPADAVDGLLIMTCTDIPWREDVFDGFDLYDVSECMEYRIHGYKVGVVTQKSPWCLHDNGISKLTNYDKYREKLCALYSEYFTFDRYYSISDKEKELLSIADALIQKINEFLAMDRPDLAYALLPHFSRLKDLDDKINRLLTIFAICEAGEDYMFLAKMGSSVKEIFIKLDEWKFLLRRKNLGDAKAGLVIEKYLEDSVLTESTIAVINSRLC